MKKKKKKKKRTSSKGRKTPQKEDLPKTPNFFV